MKKNEQGRKGCNLPFYHFYYKRLDIENGYTIQYNSIDNNFNCSIFCDKYPDGKKTIQPRHKIWSDLIFVGLFSNKIKK